MKKLFITSLLLCCAIMAQAQEQVRVWKNGESKRFTTSELTFSDGGANISVNDSTYDVMTIDSITVVHTITVTFAGDTAYVDYGHAPNVTDTIQGAHVKLISTNTKSELEFVLQGESTHGSLTYDGPLKCKFHLNGLNLKSDKGAALDIKCGKRIDLILNPGTENYLTDAAGGEHKAALHCKGHLEVSGSGNLTVTGNTKHGIHTKEYMEIKKSTGKIVIKKAMSDAMHIGQYFLMSGGQLSIPGQQPGDGIQVELMTIVTEDNDTIPNPDKEHNGEVMIRGGVITVNTIGDCVKGIKSPGNMTVSGGTITVNAQGEGNKGISVSGDMLINEDDVNETYPKTNIIIKANGGDFEPEDDDEDNEHSRPLTVKGNLTIMAGYVKLDNKGSDPSQYGGEYYKSPNATVSGSIQKKVPK